MPGELAWGPVAVGVDKARTHLESESDRIHAERALNAVPTSLSTIEKLRSGKKHARWAETSGEGKASGPWGHQGSNLGERNESLLRSWVTLANPSSWSPPGHERTPLLTLIDSTDFLGFRGGWDSGGGVVRWKKRQEAALSWG